MDLKRKFLQLKSLHFSFDGGTSKADGGLSPEGEEAVMEAAASAYPVKTVEQRNLPLTNPHKETDVLESIETVYYSDDASFDPSLWELNRIGKNLAIEDIVSDRKTLKEQLSVVSKKISDLILRNHPSYAAELQKVAALQKSLLLAYDVCCTARSNLRKSQLITTEIGVRILANYKKRLLMRKVLDSLGTIKTLQETDIRLRELLQEGNYSGAIQLCLECQRVAVTYRHFNSIGELSCKLQDTLVMMEEQLDRALSHLALSFDPDRYSRLQIAYSLLGKTKSASDFVVKHTLAGINSNASMAIEEFLGGAEGPDPKTYLALCKKLPPHRFLEALTELCRSQWEILNSFHQVMRFHMEEISSVLRLPGTEKLSSEDEEYTREILLGAREKIWSESVTKVATLIRVSDLTSFKFDSFLDIVQIGNRFSEIGSRYFGSGPSALDNALQEQTTAYFKCYHRARMEELRAFLESEAWELCPVPKTFSVFELPEYGFFAENLPKDGSRRSSENDGEISICFMDPSDSNPFHSSGVNHSETIPASENGVEDDSSDDEDAVKATFVEGDGNRTTEQKIGVVFKSVEEEAPILCNTSLNLLRLFGRYLHMAHLLHTIAFDVITSLAQLFDYYLYVVSNFFGTDSGDTGVWMFTPQSASALKRIETTLVAPSVYPESGRIPMCHLAPIRGFNSLDHLFGLSSRIVGVESLIYVAGQLNALRNRLDQVVPTEKAIFVQQFFIQTVGIVRDLRRPVYGSVATRALNYQRVLQSVSAVNWEISELMSQHNPYVDFLVKEFHELKLRGEEVARAVPFPREGYNILWDVAIASTNRILVEGYATSRKCSNEGRALMQLDFQQLIRKLESVTQLRPIPHKEFVENYIKAYYIPETAIQGWINEHQEYSNKQILALINVSTHISRKTRQRLTAMLEDTT